MRSRAWVLGLLTVLLFRGLGLGLDLDLDLGPSMIECLPGVTARLTLDVLGPDELFELARNLLGQFVLGSARIGPVERSLALQVSGALGEAFVVVVVSWG